MSQATLSDKHLLPKGKVVLCISFSSLGHHLAIEEHANRFAYCLGSFMPAFFPSKKKAWLCIKAKQKTIIKAIRVLLYSETRNDTQNSGIFLERDIERFAHFSAKNLIEIVLMGEKTLK